MATTKFSVSAYIADGVTTDYLITWDYLDSGHIAVYVDGTPNYDPQSTYSFELINSTTVRVTDEFGNAVPSGSEIEIRRETPILDRAVTFNDGSALLAEDLNKNSDYLLYSMQEVLDTVEAAAQDGALAAQVATEELRDETIVLRDTTEGYKNETLVARDTTQTYLATVDADATAADNHRIAAAASEAAALASKNAAAASQAASATSEANAAASEAASAASEAAAAVSQAAALASENAAATSEANAAASKTAAQTAQAAAEAALDELTDLYLGAKATAPTVDNDGNALQTGALYWNSTNDTMYVWNGSAWDTLNSTTGIADGSTSTVITINPDGKTTFGGYVEIGPIDTVSDYQGVSIVNGKDSFNADTVSFIDTRNDLQTPDGHIFIVHKPDGSSSLRLGTTPAGNRAIDRRVDHLFLDGDGNISITGNLKSPNLISGDVDRYLARAQRTLSGGGKVTYTEGTTRYVSWDTRVIAIGMGGRADLAQSGYFDIIQPPAGTIINGLGSTPSVTATSSGIPLAQWQFLFYKLPLGSSYNQVPGNFYIADYGLIAADTVPDDYVLIGFCQGNSDYTATNYNLYWCDGRVIPSGTHSYPDSTWITASLTNSWSHYPAPYGPVRFRRVNNVVNIIGIATGGYAGTMFTLPAGFRPVMQLLGTQEREGNLTSRFDLTSGGVFSTSYNGRGWNSCETAFVVGG